MMRMTEQLANHNELLPHLFRVEYSRMTAVLCRHFGLTHIETAEDIASDTFLKAAEAWALQGIPENPRAWLYAVAKNRTKDHLKRLNVFQTKVKPAVKQDEIQPEQEVDFTDQTITDSQLAMIFAVCNPANAAEAQICLALQILCGFSIREIADAFLSKPDTIKKRLLRARTQLRNDNFRIQVLSETAIKERLDTVLRTLYLLFNEGYYSRSGDMAIRKELCAEAMRLCLLLIDHAPTNTRQANALMALMCYQSSRLDARANDAGEAILFDEQDKSLWNAELIDKGNYYLVNACSGNEVCKYHLEAGIAYWHTTPTGENKWQQILHLYNQLILIEYSPVTALNRTFAFAKVVGYAKGIAEAEKLSLTGNSTYHALLGYLYAQLDAEKAIIHYKEAIRLTRSVTEKKTLAKEIERLSPL